VFNKGWQKSQGINLEQSRVRQPIHALKLNQATSCHKTPTSKIGLWGTQNLNHKLVVAAGRGVGFYRLFGYVEAFDLQDGGAAGERVAQVGGGDFALFAG
jgi:hypothetical protein